MTGYQSRFASYNYEGRHVAGEELQNGLFVEVVDNKVKKVAAAPDLKFRVVEKEGPYGLKGLRLAVTDGGTKDVFFVENLPSGVCEYNEADFVIKAGKEVRMKRLLVGEEILVTVEDAVFTAAAVGGAVTVAAGGKITAA